MVGTDARMTSPYPNLIALDPNDPRYCPSRLRRTFPAVALRNER